MSATATAPTGKVYSAIGAAIAEIAKEGIGKSRKNQQQGYSFRGVDEVMNALAPVLVHSKLAILPRFKERSTAERPTRNGGIQTFATVHGEFDFVSTEDGSVHTVATFGEAQDSADKATNKAMSAAFKYACFQAFCIPLEGMGEDADSVTEEVAGKPANTKAGQPPSDDFSLADAADQVDKKLRTADTKEALDAYWRDTRQVRERIKQAEPRAHEALVKVFSFVAEGFKKPQPDSFGLVDDEIPY
jgi:hypothetical protein